MGFISFFSICFVVQMSAKPPPPKSCDTFVVLGDRTKGGHIVFGKNSDRPQDEVQEVVYHPAATHTPGSKVKVRGSYFMS